MKTALRITLLAGLSASVSGCISFGAKPPSTLVRLSSTQQATADAGMPIDPNKALTVMVPSAPAEVTVTRIPVRSGAAQLTYLKDALYSDAPTKLFRDLLMDTIRARTGRTTLEGRDYHLAGGPRLTTRIDMLAVDADTHKVDMIVDAVLAVPGAGADAAGTATTRRFESHVPVSAIDAATVGPAVSQAANDVATQVADWIGR